MSKMYSRFLIYIMENDFNLLFVACHKNRSFLTKKKSDEHGISAKNKNNKGQTRR